MGREPIYDLPNVVVSSKVEFSYPYEIKMAEARQVFQDWIIENLGYEAKYDESYVSYETTAYFQFFFETEEDAAAFKMRWW